MEENRELQLAWDFVENTGVSIFLTGKAGTGKTTFLRDVRQRSPKRMVVVAPTGVAAINAGGQTIHSFFQLPLSPFVPEARIKERFDFSKEKKKILRTLDLLVIDEISMVRSDLLDAIDNVMRRFRDPRRPFGGAQLLMIGDLQQLTPVVTPSDEALLRKYYDIVKAVAYKEGVWVESTEHDPLGGSDKHLDGYVDRITSQWHWVGFFETREEAVKAYNKFMDDCIAEINEKKVGA